MLLCNYTVPVPYANLQEHSVELLLPCTPGSTEQPVEGKRLPKTIHFRSINSIIITTYQAWRRLRWVARYRWPCR